MKQLKAKLKILLLVFIGTLLILFIGFSAQVFGNREKLVIGAKNCAEQHILAEILAQLIERDTHLQVVRKFNLEGTTICFNALKSKTIDLYVEYTGTAILNILKEPIPQQNLYDYAKEIFETKYEILWLNRLGFSNQYALIARNDSGLETISDLTKNSRLKIAFDPEFASRIEPKLLEKRYGKIDSEKLMDQVLLYISLSNRSLDVVSGFSTDGHLAGKEFVILEDDSCALPKYEAAPLITKDCLKKHPELSPVLKQLAGAVSTCEMSRLNYLVEIKKRDVKQVAREFLQKLPSFSETPHA